MFKLLSIFTLVAVACVNAAPGGLFAAAPAAIAAPIVTARSSQVVARNYNTLAAAPLAYTAAAVAAPIAYTAPAAAAAVAAPLAAAPLTYTAPFPAAAAPLAYAAHAYPAAPVIF